MTQCWKFFTKASKILGGAGTNFGIIYRTYQEDLKQKAWFRSLPPKEQKALYDSCPQNAGSPVMGLGFGATAILCAAYSHTNPMIKNGPLKSFEETYPEAADKISPK